MKQQTTSDNRHSVIAWAGWSMAVPSDWVPLKIEGTHRKGLMMIGNSDQPIVLVQWEWPQDRKFDGSSWLKQRFKTLGAVPERDAPRPRGFTNTAWLKDMQVREGRNKALWCGYAKDPGIAVEVVAVRFDGESTQHDVFDAAVRAMSVDRAEKGCKWCVYDISFTSPPGFTLKRKHLFSGDIAFQFKNDNRETLLLRQVYPAALAVKRRTLERWLEVTPFTERHHLPRDARKYDWNCSKRINARGIKINEWKRLPSPLGWLKPNYSMAVAAVDEALDRLLIAEHRTAEKRNNELTEWSIQNMNTIPSETGSGLSAAGGSARGGDFAVAKGRKVNGLPCQAIAEGDGWTPSEA